MENKTKMYILIRNDVDLGHAILGAAHASLSGYLTFLKQEHSLRELCHGESPYELPTTVENWVEQSFRKVVCRVTIEEFEKAKTYGLNMIDYRIMVESGLDNQEVAIVFKPRDNFESFFKSLKLYK